MPILASDMPEMKKKIEDYGIGLTVARVLDPEAIASAVNKLSNEDLARMRRNCAEYAIAENWENYSARLTDLHLRLGKESGAVEYSFASKIRDRIASLLKRK